MPIFESCMYFMRIHYKNHTCMPDAFHFDVIKFMHVNLMCYWVSPISELLLPYSITQPLRIWCAPINLIELYQYVFNNITKKFK